MIREAKGIATLEGLADAMDFEAGSAEALAFPDNSFDAVFSVTVMEEVNTG
jgi:ubiquinone/menaquinone biosynthesis C-methylase UbiE